MTLNTNGFRNLHQYVATVIVGAGPLLLGVNASAQPAESPAAQPLPSTESEVGSAAPPVATSPPAAAPAIPPPLDPAPSNVVAAAAETRVAGTAPIAEKDVEEASPVVKASGEGFAISSADKAFVIKFRGYAQADARLFLDDVEEPPPHTFVLRRVRLIFEGTLYQYFGFRVMPDFGGGQTTLQDFHLEVLPLKEIALRFGKFKAPFDLERLQSATNILFLERAFPTQLAPNRDIGLQVYGEVAGGTLQYAGGVFNGVPDGGSSDGDVDKHKDLVGRVFAHPLRPTGVSALKDFGVGIAASTGTAKGTAAATSVPQYRTNGQQVFFRYRAVEDAPEQTVIADGPRHRFAPQLYYFYGPLGVLGAYTYTGNKVRVGDATRVIENSAWHASATFTINGSVSYEGVKPASSVGEGGIGAFEIAARYQALRIDEHAFPLYADEARSARSADGLGLGVGWWANRSVRFMTDYESTTFEGGNTGGSNRPAERAVLFRSQVGW